MLEAGIPGAAVEVDGDDGVHFAARIVYDGFAGLNPVKRHQLVYRALGASMGQAIHALSIQTYTGEEWQRQQPFRTL
jgi:acid stress-induced BolA-like protein IbaG/YrbA